MHWWWTNISSHKEQQKEDYWYEASLNEKDKEGEEEDLTIPDADLYHPQTLTLYKAIVAPPVSLHYSSKI